MEECAPAVESDLLAMPQEVFVMILSNCNRRAILASLTTCKEVYLSSEF
jgi:hypothetical protein